MYSFEVNWKMHAELEDTFMAPPSVIRRKAARFLRFIAQVSRAGVFACQAALEVGFLDLLLCLYLYDSPPSTESVADHNFDARRNTATLGLLSALSTLAQVTASTLTTMIQIQIRDRGTDWRSLDRELVVWRLRTIKHMELSCELVNGTTEMFDIIVDLLEFSDSHIYEHSTEKQALSLLLWSLSNSADSQILSGSCESALDKLTRIIRRMMHTSSSIEQYLSMLDSVTFGHLVNPRDHLFAPLHHGSSQALHLAGILAVPLAIVKNNIYTPSAYDLRLKENAIPRPLYSPKLKPSALPGNPDHS